MSRRITGEVSNLAVHILNATHEPVQRDADRTALKVAFCIGFVFLGYLLGQL